LVGRSSRPGITNKKGKPPEEEEIEKVSFFVLVFDTILNQEL
jgi:hypothetical protein